MKKSSSGSESGFSKERTDWVIAKAFWSVEENVCLTKTAAAVLRCKEEKNPYAADPVATAFVCIPCFVAQRNGWPIFAEDFEVQAK